MQCIRCDTLRSYKHRDDLLCTPSSPCDLCTEKYNDRHEGYVQFRLLVTKTDNEALRRIVVELPPELWQLIRSFTLAKIPCFQVAGTNSTISPPVFHCYLCEIAQPMRFWGNSFSYSEFGDEMETTTSVVPNNRAVFDKLPKNEQCQEVAMSAFDAIPPQDTLKAFRLGADQCIFMLEINEESLSSIGHYCGSPQELIPVTLLQTPL